MDDRTFGGSQAAKVLVDILKIENDAYLTRKISSKLHELTARLHDISICTQTPKCVKNGLEPKIARWAMHHAWNDFKLSMENIDHINAKTHALNVGKMHFQEYFTLVS